MEAGEVCNCTAISGNDGINTSMAKPDNGIRPSAMIVFKPVLDSLILLILIVLNWHCKSRKAGYYVNYTIQRDDYTNQISPRDILGGQDNF